MSSVACHDSRNSGIVFVTTSACTPRSAQIWKRASVRAAYWFLRIGCTATRSRTGIVKPADRISSTAFSRGRCACRLPGVVSENPWRDDARGGQGKAPERAPDEVLRSHGPGERAPQRFAGPDRATWSGRWRSRCSSWASRRGPRETGAREGWTPGRVGEGRGRCRGSRRAGPPRSRARRARLGTRSGRAVPGAPSRNAGCARGSRDPGVWRVTRKGPVPRGCRLPSPPRRRKRSRFWGRSGGTGRSGADLRAGSRSLDPVRHDAGDTRRSFLRDSPARRGSRRRPRASGCWESRIERSREALTAAAFKGSTVREDDSRTQVQPHRRASSVEDPALTQAPARGCPASRWSRASRRRSRGPPVPRWSR